MLSEEDLIRTRQKIAEQGKLYVSRVKATKGLYNPKEWEKDYRKQVS